MYRPRTFLLAACSLALIACAAPPSAETQEPETAHHEPEAAEDEDLWPKNGDEALEWLLAGNERFVASTPRHDHESIKRRMSLSDHQHPFAIVLGCADSRVPPELILDHGLGDLFVIRVAGNVVAEDEAGSIEYAAGHLDTPLTVVLGHEGCGAITAALGNYEEEPSELITLMQRIQPALAGIDRTLPKDEQIRLGVDANVRHSVRLLQALAGRIGRPEGKRMKIVGAVYELETGRVRIVD